VLIADFGNGVDEGGTRPSEEKDMSALGCTVSGQKRRFGEYCASIKHVASSTQPDLPWPFVGT
jgi:hypothetical protein